MAFENFPYANFHELNLDWILERVKEAYSASNPPDYPVKSVNGMTGDVIIAIPSNLVQSVNGESGVVVLYRNPLVQFPTTDEQRWNLFRICDGSERGIEFDEDGAHRIEGTRRILIYDEENQPDFPVTSVNGQTGDVRITAGVNSVNGKTGNVVTPFVNPNTDILKLDSNSNTVLWGISRDVAGGNVALYISRGSGTPQAFIRYTPTDGEPINLPLLTNADIPAEAGVVSVNTKTGAVTLYGSDILVSENSATNIAQALSTEAAERENADNTIAQNIDDLMLAAFDIVPGTELEWARGDYAPSTGEAEYGQYRIRMNVDIPDQYPIIKSRNNIVMSLQAWENDTYIGLYKENIDSFSPATSYSSFIYTELNIKKFKEQYPTYRFRIVARFNPSAIITTEAAEYIDLYKPASGESADISALRETVNTHTQQISDLQDADTTHEQQISALQTGQATQDQQISALQTSDSSHAQQISALQSADATHEQQISAIQAKDNTQDQQISELYTRTGVYAISIPNANTLPLRYPASGTDSKIKDTNKVVSMDLSIPGTQVYNWTITTYDGYLEIIGTMNGTSDITLYLA